MLSLGATAVPAFAATTTTAGRVPAANLCRFVARVDHLVVTRRLGRPTGTQFSFNFPTVVRVSNAVEAKAVTRAACSLLPAPTGIHSCPIAFDVSYHLVFSLTKSQGTVAVELEPTGCMVLSGLAPVRSPTARFYRLLAHAMGLEHADAQTFAGA